MEEVHNICGTHFPAKRNTHSHYYSQSEMNRSGLECPRGDDSCLCSLTDQTDFVSYDLSQAYTQEDEFLESEWKDECSMSFIVYRRIMNNDRMENVCGNGLKTFTCSSPHPPTPQSN